MRNVGHLVAATTPGGGSGNGSLLARCRADTKSALDLGHEGDMRGSSLEQIIYQRGASNRGWE